MNGWVKKVGIGLAILFLGFSAHWVFIDRPATYATKSEVNELKCDLSTWLERIEGKMDKLLFRGKDNDSTDRR